MPNIKVKAQSLGKQPINGVQAYPINVDYSVEFTNGELDEFYREFFKRFQLREEVIINFLWTDNAGTRTLGSKQYRVAPEQLVILSPTENEITQSRKFTVDARFLDSEDTAYQGIAPKVTCELTLTPILLSPKVQIPANSTEISSATVEIQIP